MFDRNRTNRKLWSKGDVQEQGYYIGPDDVGPELDYPMDAFDKQLLTGEWSVLQQSDYANPEQTARWSRSEDFDMRNTKHYNENSLRDDLRAIVQPSTSSSSPSLPISSPTVSALQKKHQFLQRSKQIASTSCLHAPQTNASDAVSLSGQAHRSNKFVTTSPNLPHAPPVIQGIPLVSTDRLPDHLKSIFKFELFNAVQSKCFSAAFGTDDNIVLSAPTGSGKTVVMELALCRLIVTGKNQDFKVVYQAPTKSLCNERCRDWRSKFNTLGLQCAELTGDVEPAQLKTVQSAQIIITTPEKWDSVTRKWKDNARLMQMIKLFLVDEVHILNENRGATLEAVVSRMKLAGSGVRFVALSATVPNSDDIAVWLGQNNSTQHLPAYREVFDEAFRPVKLEKHVIGYNCRPNDFALDSILTKEIPNIIARHAKRKPVMIFCVTKNSAAKTASALAELWLSTVSHLQLWGCSKQLIRVQNQDLQNVLRAGVAFHHSGLDVADRQAIEQGFLHGDISIICSTSTLAVGVNLPCYLVILKGTSCWSDNGLQEYSSLDIMQMLGRAGRPQYETSACAIILTRNEKVRHYEEMMSGQEVLESCLHNNLIEHLNAEIGIGTIDSTETAKKWLASSFLSVRLRQNPNYYRLQSDTSSQNVDRLLEQICERDLQLLQSAQLVTNTQVLRCTSYGEAMSRYYVKYETMTAFLKLSHKARMSEILHVLTKANEFNDLRLRSGEKSMYKYINQANETRYPIKVDIALPSHKTSLLIQAQLGGVLLDKSNAKSLGQFKQDTLAVTHHANRLIRCLIDMQIYRQDSISAKSALELCRSLAAGVWDNTPMQLKQIESIGDVTARKLASAGVKDIDTLSVMEPQQIEMILGKCQPFGSTLLKKVAKFPKLRVSVKEVQRTKKYNPQGVELRLACEVGYLNDSPPEFFNRKSVYVCFLCETSYGEIVDFRRFGVNCLRRGDDIRLTVFVNKPCSYISCHVMCDEIAGTHRCAELSLDIPSTWLLCTGNVVHENAPAQDVDDLDVDLLDNFDDAGVTDGDLLAVESGIETVDHIEDDVEQMSLPPSNTNQAGDSLKRRTDAMTEKNLYMAKTKDYRTPKRLANGNWTCQHTCNELGKECKHRCCKEGVKKPKKRAKVQNSIQQPASMMKNALDNASQKSYELNADRLHGIENMLNKPAKFQGLSDIMETKSQDVGSYSTTQTAVTNLSVNDLVVDIDDLQSPTATPLRSCNTNESDTFPSQHVSVRGNQGGDPTTEDLQCKVKRCDWKNSEIIESVSNMRRGHSRPALKEYRSSDDALLTTKDLPSLQDIINPQMIALGSSGNLPKSEMKSSDRHNDQENSEDDDFSDLHEIEDSELFLLGTGRSDKAETAEGQSSSMSIEYCSEDMSHQAINGASTSENWSTRTPVEEAEVIQQEGQHIETQRQKWARLPAWLYKEYGAYINII